MNRLTCALVAVLLVSASAAAMAAADPVLAASTAPSPMVIVGQPPRTVPGQSNVVPYPLPPTPRSPSLPITFRADPYEARDLPVAERPWTWPHPVPRVDSRVHDAHGVRMWSAGGVLYDYPGGQASYGLANLDSYRLTEDTFFLDRAIAQATRLIATHVEAGGAWYFPHRYERERHGDRDAAGDAGETMRSPWYSALCQGESLALFARLYETTGESYYLYAARGTLASFLRPGPVSGPWTVDVDSDGYLWCDEWPLARSPDFTLNGHIFALFGLYEYCRVTGDERALTLYRGGLTTVHQYAGAYRTPGWRGFYCLRHRVAASPTYHRIHIGQFLELYTLTGDVTFARLADTFSNDYPYAAVNGTLRIAAGSYTATRFDARGNVRVRRTIVAGATTSVAVSRRCRIQGRSGIWYLMSSGPWSGYWLREAAGRVYLLGTAAVLAYSPPRTVTFFAGDTYSGRRYDDTGRVRGETTLHSDENTAAPVTKQAVVDGVKQVLVSDGPWARYWFPLAHLALR